MPYQIRHGLVKTFMIHRPAAGNDFTTGSSMDWDNDRDFEFTPIISDSAITLAEPRVEVDNQIATLIDSHAMVKGRKSEGSSVGLGFYINGLTSVAASGSVASRDTLSMCMGNAVGIQTSGSHAGITGGTSASPTIDAADTDLVAGCVGFFIDADTGLGEAALITDRSGDTLTVYPPLSFTPADGDRVESCIATGLDEEALTVYTDDHYHIDNFLEAGSADEDYRAAVGVKLNMGEVAITTGEMTKVTFEGTPVDHHLAHTFTRPAATGALDGTNDFVSPQVVGQGNSLTVRFGDAEGTLTSIDAVDCTFNPGVAHEALNGITGREGILTFMAGRPTPTFNLTTWLTASYGSEFDLQTAKAATVQVGDQSGRSWGLIFRNLEENRTYGREEGENGALLASRAFKARYHTGSIAPAHGTLGARMLRSPAIMWRAG